MTIATTERTSAPRRAPRDPGKTSSDFLLRAAGGPVAWRDVLAVLQDDETRSYALSRFRDAGFSADAFGHRRAAREALADALTRTEDWLEYREVDHPRRAHWYRPQREAIRGVRRRLEWELWP